MDIFDGGDYGLSAELQRLLEQQGGHCAVSGALISTDPPSRPVADMFRGAMCLVCKWVQLAAAGNYDDFLLMQQQYYQIASTNLLFVTKVPVVDHPVWPLIHEIHRWIAITFRFDRARLSMEIDGTINLTIGERYGDPNIVVMVNLDRATLMAWDSESYGEGPFWCLDGYDVYGCAPTVADAKLRWFERLLADPDLMPAFERFMIRLGRPSAYPGQRCGMHEAKWSPDE